MRYFILMVLLTGLFFNTAKSQHVLRVFLDHNMPVTTVINDSKVFNAQLKVKKYINTKSLLIKIEGKSETPFKHTLQLANDRDSIIMTVVENPANENSFTCNITSLKKLVSKYPNQKLYYIEEPKNNMMKMRSKSILLMNIHFY